MRKKYLFFLITFVFFPLSSFAYTPPTNLIVGSSGPQVVELQAFLEESGYLIIPRGVKMGYFGLLTRTALAKYKAAPLSTTTPVVVDSVIACPIGYICIPISPPSPPVLMTTLPQGPIPTPIVVVPQSTFYTTNP